MSAYTTERLSSGSLVPLLRTAFRVSGLNESKGDVYIVNHLPPSSWDVFFFLASRVRDDGLVATLKILYQEDTWEEPWKIAAVWATHTMGYDVEDVTYLGVTMAFINHAMADSRGKANLRIMYDEYKPIVCPEYPRGYTQPISIMVVREMPRGSPLLMDYTQGNEKMIPVVRSHKLPLDPLFADSLREMNIAKNTPEELAAAIDRVRTRLLAEHPGEDILSPAHWFSYKVLFAVASVPELPFHINKMAHRAYKFQLRAVNDLGQLQDLLARPLRMIFCIMRDLGVKYPIGEKKKQGTLYYKPFNEIDETPTLNKLRQMLPGHMLSQVKQGVFSPHIVREASDIRRACKAANLTCIHLASASWTNNRMRLKKYKNLGETPSIPGYQITLNLSVTGERCFRLTPVVLKKDVGDNFSAGSIVRLFGLQAEQYNGLLGRIISGINEQDRYACEITVLQGTEKKKKKRILLREKNLFDLRLSTVICATGCVECDRHGVFVLTPTQGDREILV